MEDGFQSFRRHTFVGNVLKDAENGLFERLAMLGVAPFNPAAKNHLTHRFLDTTEGRGGRTQVGGLQKLHQG